MCVLIVEDEILIRMGTAVILEDAGHEVMCAADGHEAVELIDRHHHRFSALVTDYHMPGRLTGADVVQYTRQRYPTIPMYMVSARTNMVSETWCRQYDVTMLAKPYEPEVLAHLIQRAIAG